MENNVVNFSVSVYKKTEVLSESFFSERGIVPKARSKAIQSARIGLEAIVIEKGGITTHAGYFVLIYQGDHAKPWALVAYRPSFNYDVFTELHQMNDYLAINAPGIRI